MIPTATNKPAAILFSTTDGHTLNICKRIASHMEHEGCKAHVKDISDFHQDINDFSKIIIGASIRYGKHDKAVTNFIQQHKKALEKTDTAFFSVNLVARKSDKNTAETNPYVIKFFKELDWKPTVTDVFAGRLDYASYTFIDRLMIRLIMKITKGPTKTDRPIEYTDWDRVKAFSLKMCGKL